MRTINILMSFLVLSILWFSNFTLAYAAGETMDFTVKPIISSELQEVDKGYFDFQTTPNTVYDLQLEIVNKSDGDSIYEIEITNAITNNVGEVIYTESSIIDKTLAMPLSSLSAIQGLNEDGNITIPQNKSSIINFTITSPSTDYEGLILGGIRVKDITARVERENMASEGKEDSGIEIYKEYQNVIGIKLHSNNNPVDFDFELDSVEPTLFNYRAAIIVNIRNIKPVHVKDALFSGKVSTKGSDDFIFSIDNLRIDMAPNSVMKYLFKDEEGRGLTPGTYIFTGSLLYENQKWEFNQEFTIKQEQASQINQEFTIKQEQASQINQAAVNQQGSTQTGIPSFAWIIMLILLILIVVLLTLLLIFKIKKNMGKQD